MDLHRLGRLPLLTLALLGAGCATQRDQLAGERPRDVAVVVRSAVQVPAAQNVVDDVAGVESPAGLLARESQRALQARGYAAAVIGRAEAPQGAQAPGCDGKAMPAASCNRAAAIATAAGRDATLFVELERMDLESLRMLGRTEIELQAFLVDAGGALLWAGEHRGVTRVTTYRAGSDWRAHLRDALDEALRELP